MRERMYKWVHESVKWTDELLNYIAARAVSGAAGQSPQPLARNEDENSADGNEAVLEGGHRQDGELGPILQRKYSKQPPAPRRTTGTGLQENTDIHNSIT